MSRSTPTLSALALLAALAPPLPARAEAAGESAFPEVGGWGQAWGEDDLPRSLPARERQRPAAPLPSAMVPLPTTVVPSASPPPPPQTRVAALPLDENGGQPYPEVGGWGQAWGEEDSPRPSRPRSTAMPSTLDGLGASAPVPTAAPAPQAIDAAAPPQVQDRVRVAYRPDQARPNRGGFSTQADETGDAIGLKRPPRVVPRALSAARRSEEGASPAVHMEADQVIYDREFNVVTAKGRVEMVQSDRSITADTVSYNMKMDKMAASGNVVLTEPSGEVTRADYFELTGDFKEGVAANLRMVLADNSRLSALRGQRTGGDRTDMDRVVYTACEPCRDDPDRTPLWLAKAQRVTHNQAEGQIEYRDAWIELAGIPVLYTPYLSHPDPSVKRKSGFLAPTVGYSSKQGATLTTPYFMVLSDSEDVTLTPRFMFPDSGSAATLNSATDADELTTRAMQHLLLQGEHRWRGLRGETKTTASITADKDTGDTRGHIESKGVYELNRVWRAGWQLQHQSDNYYADYYRIRTERERPWRITRPYVEGFGRRNHAMVEAMSFQGRQVVSDGSKPTVVLPHMSYSGLTEPGWGGSYWSIDSDALSYMRTKGTEAQRLSQRVGWHLPLVSPDGQIVQVNADVRADGYRSSGMTGVKDGTMAGRAIPEVSANWRYPFTRPGMSVSQVIEPVVMVAASPNGGNSSKIPNEDSLAFELDETNIIRPNRMPGLDRVEGGLRGAYALRYNAYPLRGGRVGAQVAQGWRQRADSTFAGDSGFSSNLSDYVARADVEPSDAFMITERIRLDKDSLSLKRHEASVSVGPPPLAFNSSYGYVKATQTATGTVYPDRHYMTFGINSHISQYWSATGTLSQDLGVDGGVTSWRATTTYSDECFALVGAVNHYYSNAPGLGSGYNAMLSVVLKSLGEAPVSLF